MGHVGCYYLVGGVDFTGSHIYSIHAHGSGIEKPFDAEGSGSLCALGELETRFKPNMTVGCTQNSFKIAFNTGGRMY